tara:strand:+ start:255 stop:455 length:201 start_codon:yes stop_codon:yes gene_type:complete
MRQSEFVYPVQTKKMRENNEDPRVKVSDMLKGPKRLEGESFTDYKIRLKVEKSLTRDYLKGYLIER